MKTRIAVLLLALPLLAASQNVRVGRGIMSPTTVARLPTTAADGLVVAVTDGDGVTSCTAGGGSTVTFCQYDADGAFWFEVSSAGVNSFDELSNVTSGTSPPATCTPPAFFRDTDARSGSRLLYCGATNEWRGLDATEFNVVDYGADPTFTTESSAEIQAAIDACHAETTEGASDFGAGVVFFPAGKYNIDTTLDWKHCPWQGAVTKIGTQIIWEGAAGGLVVSQTTQGSYNYISRIHFGGGTNRPATFIDFSALPGNGSIDSMLNLTDVQFQNGSGDAIIIGKWISIFFQRLRWDKIAGWAITLTPVQTQNDSTFLLDQFYIDMTVDSGDNPPGFIKLDITAGSQTDNLGLFHLSNGRIENNVNWGGNKAVLEIVHNATPPTRTISIVIENVVYDDQFVPTPDEVLVYRNTTDTTGTESLRFINVRARNLSAVLGGTWPANFPIPEVPFNGVIDYVTVGQDVIQSDNAQFTLQPRSTADHALRVKEDDDADFTFELGTDGSLNIGDGTNPPDVVLSRSAADILGLASGDAFQIGADPADAFDIRLENAACVGWEADPAGTDLSLCVNASEQFAFNNGADLVTIGGANTLHVFDATPTTGSTTLIAQGGAGQGTDHIVEIKHSGGDIGISLGSFANHLRMMFHGNGIISGNGQTLTGAHINLNLTNPSVATSGSVQHVRIGNASFAPTSGTADFTGLDMDHTINQTGGANGITRGIFLNPTITAAADFRAMEIADVGASHFALKTGTGKVEFGGGVDVGAAANITYFDSVNVASTATMTLPAGNLFHITGTDAITTMNTCDSANNGRLVTLIFDAVLTFTDGNNLKINGDFVTTADDTIQLMCDGTNWFQQSRSIN